MKLRDHDASGVRTNRRRASLPRFRAAQLLGRCNPLCQRHLARAALERQRPPRTCGNSSRPAARLPSVTIGSARQRSNAQGSDARRRRLLRPHRRRWCGFTRGRRATKAAGDVPAARPAIVHTVPRAAKHRAGRVRSRQLPLPACSYHLAVMRNPTPCSGSRSSLALSRRVASMPNSSDVGPPWASPSRQPRL